MQQQDFIEIVFRAYNTKTNGCRNVRIRIPQDYPIEFDPLDDLKYLEQTKPKRRMDFLSRPPICFKGTSSTARLQTIGETTSLLICNKRFALNRKSAFSYDLVFALTCRENKKQNIVDSIDNDKERAASRVREEVEKYTKRFGDEGLTASFLEDDIKPRNSEVSIDEGEKRLLEMKNGIDDD
ncbi:hypothetical protein ENUP19_0244G0012 [Entamoeba nuttalli]|uniref:Uncharacterized protein n=1 Tax=Entamoeba nuttalli TaxID=412467 RepID=A0ABQ0DQK3_9EUKA